MTGTQWLNDREARAWRALQRLRTPLEAALNRQLAKDSGLSTADYAVLVALSEAPHCRLRARDLGMSIGWEKSRLSHQLRRMEARGLVGRQECPTDARGAFLVLTESGGDALRQAAPGHVAAVRRLIIDGLSDEQLSALAEIGEILTARIAEQGCAGMEDGADDGC